MKHSKSIIKQASILAVAGILVRIIGLLYRSPLTAIIGPEGMGYYSSAYNIYALILLISSYSIPTAISKLISEKLTLHQYRYAKKILYGSLIYITVVGGSFSIITFIISPFILPEASVPALRVLCPTIFLSGLLGVFRGYFQAHRITLYTSISQIIEQIFNAVVSVIAAYLFIQPFLNADHTLMSSMGASGSALGTGIGVLAALIYMLILFFTKKQKYSSDQDDYEESYKKILVTILNIVTPIILATCVYNIISTIDMYLLYFALGSDKEISTLWGVYAGQYIVLQNVPIALASALSTASIPAISGLWVSHQYKETRRQIHSNIRIAMLILIPSAVGMAVLSYPIISLIFPQKSTIMISSKLLAFGSPAIVFYGLSTLTNGILQSLGLVRTPLINATKALVVHCLLVIILLFFTPLGIYALLIGNCTYALHVCYLNQKALHIKLHLKPSIRELYLIPFITSIVMGIVVYLSYQGLQYLFHIRFISLGVSIVIGVVIYFIGILYFYQDHMQSLSDLPFVSRFIKK